MRPIKINEYVTFEVAPASQMQVSILVTHRDRYHDLEEYVMDREDAQRIGLMLMWAAKKSLEMAREQNGIEESDENL